MMQYKVEQMEHRTYLTTFSTKSEIRARDDKYSIYGEEHPNLDMPNQFSPSNKLKKARPPDLYRRCFANKCP